TPFDIQYSAATQIWGVTDWYQSQGYRESGRTILGYPLLRREAARFTEAAPQSLIQTPPVPQDEDEREPMFLQPNDPDYVPEPMYPEYIPLADEHVFPAEEQPLPPVVLPITESLRYIVESDLVENPEEYKDD
ncbi:hypothetical protein Tco_0809771, partial [Tanacetum coccineum]